jgi:hypothetical protein
MPDRPYRVHGNGWIKTFGSLRAACGFALEHVLLTPPDVHLVIRDSRIKPDGTIASIDRARGWQIMGRVGPRAMEHEQEQQSEAKAG